MKYGVIKMNVDTDTQYAFTRPIAGHMFANYDGVLKIDGEVGNKKAYDPRAWGKIGEAGMAERIVSACEHLSSTGTSVCRLMTFQDLMAGPPPTHLPPDPAADELAAGSAAVDVVRSHPESPVAWATLAEQALADSAADDVTAYAYARVGYHRSLDQLRRNGWKGNGPVPWEHEPNRGFLRALAALSRGRGPDRRDRPRPSAAPGSCATAAPRRTTRCSA